MLTFWEFMFAVAEPVASAPSPLRSGFTLLLLSFRLSLRLLLSLLLLVSLELLLLVWVAVEYSFAAAPD
jgi:hypothetical protein